jgi:two-component system CheB/CheR fusion protein
MLLRDGRRPGLWSAVAGVLVFAIFALDTISAPAYAVPVLYLVPTLMFLGASRFAEPLVVAAVATVLMIAGYYAGPAHGEVGLPSRMMTIAVEWMTAGLVVMYSRTLDRWASRMQSANDAQDASMRRLKDVEYALDQSVIVAATDQTGKITYVNDKFCQISKYSREELLGQDHRLINSRYHSKEYIRDLWRTIAHGQIWRGELRNRAKDGSIYWVDTTIVPFLNDQGKPWQYLAIRNDITQRKLAEQRLRDEAALTQLGRMSAVVAHEVRNPLAAVKGSLQVLASRMPADLPGREIIHPILARLETLNQTVKDILTYSKPSPPKLQNVLLAPLIDEVAQSARAAMPAAVIEIGEAAAAVARADPEMVRAVLLNLLLNACRASGAAPVQIQTSMVDGGCQIAILDRGPGLPAEVREKLFEPFISTSPGGTGLGLAIAHRLTQLQGGTLTIGDREDGGTAAVVRLQGGEHPRSK